MNELEFQFSPHYCSECAFNRFSWGEVVLTPKSQLGPALQRIVFPVRRGDTVYGFQLVRYMEQLTAMYMSTTRGLPA